MLTVTAMNAKSQTIIYNDTAIKHPYIRIHYTDSSIGLINFPLIMVTENTDKGDSSVNNGCATTTWLLFRNGKYFQDPIGTQFRGMDYYNWDANDDTQIPRIVKNILSRVGKYINFD